MPYCKKCKVFVTKLGKHLERNRCEAVKERREFRAEIGGNSHQVSKVLGKRGTRTAKRNAQKEIKKMDK